MAEIEVSDAPAADDLNVVLQGLVAYNRETQPNVGYHPLGIFVRETAGGPIMGGLIGDAAYDWLFVKIVHLDASLRGKGIGTEVMRAAETWARGKGLTGIWLDTFEFQARGFYEKLGYAVFGTIEDHPKGSPRYFLKKRLDS